MAKQSRYLQKLAAQQAVRDEKTRRFTLQQCKDMMLITCTKTSAGAKSG